MSKKRSPPSQHVTVRGKQFAVNHGALFLNGLGITSIGEIEGLDKIANLEYLHLQDNKLTSVGGLGYLKNLISLILDNNQITTIHRLDGLENLETVSLSNNRLRDTSWLARHPRLALLRLDHNELEMLTSFDGITGLQELDISYNHLVSIAVLGLCPNLAIVNADHNQLADVDVLSTFSNIRHFSARSNRITHIPALDTFMKLSDDGYGGVFKFTDNQIDTIDVKKDVGVGQLVLGGNRLIDVSWLDHIWIDDPEISLLDNPLTPEAEEQFNAFIAEVADHDRRIVLLHHK